MDGDVVPLKEVAEVVQRWLPAGNGHVIVERGAFSCRLRLSKALHRLQPPFPKQLPIFLPPVALSRQHLLAREYRIGPRHEAQCLLLLGHGLAPRRDPYDGGRHDDPRGSNRA
ncbi:hypothetical protein VTK26DRAFT_6118 [Humicola hyalothermophila]